MSKSSSYCKYFEFYFDQMASGGFSNGYSRTYDEHSTDSEHSDAESKQKRSVLKHRNSNKRTAKTMKPCLVHKNSLTSDDDSLLAAVDPSKDNTVDNTNSNNSSILLDADPGNSNSSSVTFTSAFTATSSALHNSVRQGNRFNH